MGRSVLAVIGGAIVMVTGIALVSMALVSWMPQRPAGPSAIAALAILLALNLIVACFAGGVTAALAPRDPLRHALALGIVQAILYGVSALASRGSVPAWFHVGFLLFVVPLVVLGGRVRAWRRRPSTPA